MRISDSSSDVFSSDLICTGAIMWCPWTKACPGRIHDIRLARRTGIVEHLEVGEALLADMGYVGLPRTVTPCKKRRVRKSVAWGESVSVRVDLGGGRIIKKKKTTTSEHI